MKILITGGGGYLGKKLAKALSTEHEVQASESDIRAKDLDLSRFDAVFHLAAISTPRSVEADRALAWDVNVNGTLNLCSRLKEGQRLIFFSSAHVYDRSSAKAHVEEEPPLPPNFYGLTKLAGEEIVRFHSMEKRFTPLIFRIFNVYSPDQSPGLLVGDVKEKFKKGGPVEIRDAESVLDLLHMDDAMNVFTSFMKIPAGTYNLCSGHPISIRQVYERIGAHLGKNEALTATSDKRYRLLGDNSRLRSLGFSFRPFSMEGKS